METLMQDLKFGAKLLLKEKGFTLTALITLVLCIGANTAVFTLVHSVLLRPLPYPESDRLVSIYNQYPAVGVKKASNGVPDYLDRRKETAVFEEVCLAGGSGYDVGIDGSPQLLEGVYLTPSCFRMLRVPPVAGRIFSEEEAVLGNEKVAILGYGVWKQMFGGSPSAIGKDIRLSGVPYRIVGVMPDGFQFLWQDTKVWVPFAFTPRQTSDEARHSNQWSMVARLKPGVSVAQAQQRINALNRRNYERFPEFRKLLDSARFGTKVANLKEELVEDVKPTLYLLQGAVAFVLLIGCVNIANLMLVRSNVRMKELAIRFSLGAGRWRLGRQLLTESFLLAALGGVLGLAAGFAGVRLLKYLGAAEMPRGATIQIDGTVMAFTLAVAILTGLFFGSVPLIHVFRRNLNAVFRQTERAGTAERPATIARAVLVVCQVSLAFVLLIGAGLMTLSFVRVLAVDPGFKPENVTTARLSLPRSRYGDDTRIRTFLDRALESLRTAPGVKGAAIATFLPFGGSMNASGITIVGYTRAPGENPPVPGFNTVDSGYFKAMGIPLLRGRGFEESDTDKSQPVAIIDQFLARKYWPHSDPIGAKIRQGVDTLGGSNPVFTIVGVAGSVRVSDLADQNPVGLVYLHYKQSAPGRVHLILKADRDKTNLAGAARREILKLDPELPLSDVKTMEERLANSVMNRKASMILCLVFAGLALLLSAVGIYGVLAYTVTQRTREFGVRLALGARAGDVLAMVFAQGARMAAAGLLIGVTAAYALTRVMQSLLFEVKPADPVVFVVSSAVLSAVAVLASLAPSLRATRIDPVVALRYE